MSERDSQTNQGADDGDLEVQVSGGNSNSTDAAPPMNEPVSAFEPSVQRWLEKLQEAHDPAAPVKRHGNEILVWMGEYRLEGYVPEYDQDSAEVYMLIPKSFPNCDPHWIITTPALTVTGEEPDTAMDANTFTQDHERHGDKADLVIEVSESYESARAWSWRWSTTDLDPETVEDIARAPMMVDSQLNHTEQR